MANLTFPTNPTNGQKYTFNGKVFEYSSSTGRWSATRLQVLGDLSSDFTIPTPVVTLSQNNVEFDALSNNFVNVSVDQDVKITVVNQTTNATSVFYPSNNTIKVDTSQFELVNGVIEIRADNGRNIGTANLVFSSNNQFPLVSIQNTVFYTTVGASSFDVSVTATDPENQSLTYTSSIGGYANAVQSVTNSANVYTVTVTSDNNNAGNAVVTFTVSDGVKSASKNATVVVVAPAEPDQVLFTSSTTWTVPDKVRKISAVAIGAGGNGVNTNFGSGYWSYPFHCGGGGGALAYVNEMSVTPGEQLTVVCGSGTDSYIERGGTKLLLAKRGNNGDQGGISSAPVPGTAGSPRYFAAGGQAAACIGDQAYSGGDGWLDSRNITNSSQYYPAGGGAAAGWEEDGSDAGVLGSGYTPSGGWKNRGSQGGFTRYGGGGQGLYGKNGVTNAGTQFTESDNGHGAGGGLSSVNMPTGSQSTRPNGGTYGGAGGARSTSTGTGSETPGTGANGAIRIIWGEHSAGVQRAFPETGTVDV